jgi:hypothetical protein
MNYRLRALNIVLYAAFLWLIPAAIGIAYGLTVLPLVACGACAVQFIVTVEVMMYLEE